MLSRCRLHPQLASRRAFSVNAAKFDAPKISISSGTDNIEILREFERLGGAPTLRREKKKWKRLIQLEQRRKEIESAIKQNEFQLHQFDRKPFESDSSRFPVSAANLSELLQISKRQVGRLDRLCESVTKPTDQSKLLDRWSRDNKIFIDTFRLLSQPPHGQELVPQLERLNIRRTRLQENQRNLNSTLLKAYQELTDLISAKFHTARELLQQEEADAQSIELQANGETELEMKHSIFDDTKGDVKRRKLERKPAPTLAECGNTAVLDIEAKHLLSKPRGGGTTSDTRLVGLQNVVTPDLTDSSKYLRFLMGDYQGNNNNESASRNGDIPTNSERRSGKKRQPQIWRDFELEIEDFSSVGEGLVRHPSQAHVYVVPFALPGDRVKIKAAEPNGTNSWSKADFLEILNPSKLRGDVKPQCKYFSRCGGCQLQMISYEDQLKFKRSVVGKAYQNFSGLRPSQIPEIGTTGGSPLQYGYRTKLTPHFDGPPNGTRYTASTIPPIGFTRKNFNKVMDIENCPIGTRILDQGLRTERSKIIAKIGEYKRGATVLLRETTSRTYSGRTADNSSEPSLLESSPLPPNALELPGLELQPGSDKRGDLGKGGTPGIQNTYLYQNPQTPSEPATQIHETKHYTTNNESLATEYIGSYIFKTRAGSFFQNNNSILPSFLSYVRSKILLPTASPPAATENSPQPQQIKYLLDAYCGSGLFAITLSPLFTSVLGIELDPWGVTSARQNAQLNNVTNAGFIEADAAALFEDVPYPAEHTALVIDPPRKGCSTDFLRQLLRYAPMRVVYVSCNVGTQARDVGCLVRGWCGDNWWKEDGEGMEEGDGGKSNKKTKKDVGRYRYEVEEIRGYDFFPQTGHVEGLAVLKRVDNEAWEGFQSTRDQAAKQQTEAQESDRDGPQGADVAAAVAVDADADADAAQRRQELDGRQVESGTLN